MDIMMVICLSVMVVMFIVLIIIGKIVCEISSDLICLYSKVGDLQNVFHKIRADIGCESEEIKDLLNDILKKPEEREHGEVECDIVKPDDDDDEIPIHLIRNYEYHIDNNGYDRIEVTYDSVNNKLSAHYMDVYGEDIKSVIGEGLMFFGVNPSEPNVVYVRNHKLKCDFMITRIVEGEDPDEQI